LAAGIALLLLGALGGWLYESRRAAQSDKAAIEQIVRDYILENPEILPEAIDRLRTKEAQKQLAGAGDKLFEAFPGAVLGNPQGTVTLVEFTDFACTFCRQSVADVEALVTANPDLKVVIRELPILSPASAQAARWGLAAAEQGRYAQFHKAMFAAGRPDDQTIAAAAVAAGLDLDRARRTVAGAQVEAEIAANQEFARQLGIDGTPTWVVGDEMFSGAVGQAELAKAIAKARG
jgi:protein-disulfide isomerase